MTAAIQSAMIYPAILLLAATGSIALLLTQVLPQFVPLFAENGVALPASTAFLLAAGNAVSAYGLYALAAWPSSRWRHANCCRTRHRGWPADRLMLRVPILGGLCARSSPRASPARSACC